MSPAGVPAPLLVGGSVFCPVWAGKEVRLARSNEGKPGFYQSLWEKISLLISDGLEAQGLGRWLRVPWPGSGLSGKGCDSMADLCCPSLCPLASNTALRWEHCFTGCEDKSPM